MEIREFKKNDTALLTDLLITYRKEQDRPLSKEEEERFFRNISLLSDAENTVTLVADSGEKITGYITAHFTVFPMIGGIECYISDLLVHPDTRGKSTGKKLLEEMSRIAESRGAARLMLNNHKDSESYRRDFYKKQNFTERDNFANFVKMV